MDDTEKGRPSHGTDFASAVAQRVKAIRARLGTLPAEPTPEWQRLTRRRFAERIGMSEAALADRLRTSSPTLFSAQELATICAEFRVRADYLLLGQEPMMQDDIVDPDPSVSFAAAFHQHIARVLDVRLEQDAEWIASFLGDSDTLLASVELGVADALDERFQSAVSDRRLASSWVREAVATRARATASIPSVPDDFFKVATDGLHDGSMIDLGTSEPAAPAIDPSSTRVEQLKTLAEVSMPDSRRLGWSIRNHATGEIRPLQFSDHYRAIEGITLDEAVPESIRTLFNTARNVLLYSWQVYRFTVVAELQAYATLEYALRERMGIGGNSDGPGLAKLLKRAARERLLSDDTFATLRSHPQWPVFTGNSFIDANADRQVVEARGHVAILSEALPMLRNTLAHGSSSVWPDALATFRLIAVAINWMYTSRAG
jgi:transcriptional regulator with XRE-family HTH domain